MLRICMINAPPVSSTPDNHIHVLNLLRLLEPHADEIFVITGNFPQDAVDSEKIHIKNIEHRSDSRWMLLRIPRFILMQLKISYHLIKLAKKIDVVFFSIGAALLTLPMMLAKLIRKRVIFIYPGVGVIKKVSDMAYEDKLWRLGGRMYSSITAIMEGLNCSLADKIIVFSSNSAQSLAGRHGNKVSIASRFFVDDTHSKIEKDVTARMKLIGFIGRFGELTGIPNLIESIPLILNHAAEVKFIIGGDGPLRDSLEKQIKETNLGDAVAMLGWIPRDEVCQRLNELKLLVIPSYYDVGPQILFEAMACGTPVLATPVGVVTDVIRDRETGFIMPNNSPECIAENVIRALEYPNLSKIVNNARKLIEREYTYKAAAERYKKVFESA